MKASASIMRLLVGALATVALVTVALVTVALVSGWGSPAGTPASALASAPVVRQQASKPKPASLSPSPRPTRVEGPPLLNIPRLDLKVRIGTNLKHGPVWWPVTGRPGGGDTIAVAGHRTTYTRPFYSLERLRPGDSIYVRWGGRMHAYRVSGQRILSAKNLHIGDARGYEVLLLSACNPRGSATHRIVVYARPA